MKPDTWITRILISTLTLATASYALAQDVQHGRISYADDDGLIRGSEDADWSVAQLNSLVMPGDTIWADENGILEVEVSGGSFLRLADGSKLDVVAMPPTTHIKGWAGSFYIHRLRNSEGDFTFETPVGQISVEANSQVRIDVLEEGSTTISTRWGNAIVRTPDGDAIRVTSGRRVFIDPGYLPSSPTAFDRGQEDAFDTWNRERSRKIAQGASISNIGSAGSYSAPIGSYDLNEYGNWVYVDNSYYWQPTVVTNYVPYRVGSWSYVPNHGHVWVGHHPFTYITSHHGYWSHHDHHGWIWSYNRTYSPAYVASVYYEDNFIWAPLSHHGDAVYLSGSYFTAGGFHFSIGFSTYAHSSHLYGGHHNVYALNHHGHINNHHYYNANRWNVCATNSHHYVNRPHRNPYRRARDYAPTRVMRGPSESINGTRTYNARSRIGALEARNSRASFKPVSEVSRSTRTSSRRSMRDANTRTVTFKQDPVQRLASRSDRLKRVPTPTTDRASATRTIRTDRTSRTTSIGTINDNRTRPIKPRVSKPGKEETSTPSNRRTISTRPNSQRGTSEQSRIRSNTPTTRESAPTTTQRTTRTPNQPRTTIKPKSTRSSTSFRSSTPPRSSQPTAPPRTTVRNTPTTNSPKQQVQSRSAPTQNRSTQRQQPAPAPSRQAAPAPQSSSSNRSGVSQQRSSSRSPSRSAPSSSSSRSSGSRGGRR